MTIVMTFTIIAFLFLEGLLLKRFIIYLVISYFLLLSSPLVSCTSEVTEEEKVVVEEEVVEEEQPKQVEFKTKALAISSTEVIKGSKYTVTVEVVYHE